MGRIDFETETMLVYMPARSFGTDGGVDERFAERDICDALHTASGVDNKAPLIAFNSNAQVFQMQFDAHTSAALTTSQRSAVAFQSGADRYNGRLTGDVAATLGTQSGDGISSGPSVLSTVGVRRLTPRECERLQGFPDDYTAIPKAADGPRYKALGNSKAVPVVRWIGKRIDFVMRWF